MLPKIFPLTFIKCLPKTVVYKLSANIIHRAISIFNNKNNYLISDYVKVICSFKNKMKFRFIEKLGGKNFLKNKKISLPQLPMTSYDYLIIYAYIWALLSKLNHMP